MVEAAKALEVPVETASGKVTGHTMRVTGAQGLAAGGLDLWAIQLLGRWGSMAVKAYVRESHLEQAEFWARRVGQRRDLDEMVADVANRVEEKLRGQELWAAAVAAASSSISSNQVDQKALDKEKLKEDSEALAVEAIAHKGSGKPTEDAVISEKGIVHAILLGPPAVPSEMAMTSCGWKFGRSSSAALIRRSELPESYKVLCAKCFPREREGAKEKLRLLAAEL